MITESKYVPFDYAKAITPSDSTIITKGNRGLIVSGAGNVSLDIKADNGAYTTVVLAVSVGVVYQISFARVRSTGTTATGITGLGYC